MYAQVAINAPVDRVFDYHIPSELDGALVPGHLVQVPFRTAMEYGIVVGLHDETPIVETKPILARLDPTPVLTEAQIDLARWLSQTTLAPLGFCLWLFLPPGIATGRDIQVTLLREDAPPADDLEYAVLTLLKKRGKLRGSQLNLALAGKQWRTAVDALAKAGIVHKEHILKAPRVRPKVIQTAALAIHPDAVDDAIASLGRPSSRTERLGRVLHLLARDGGTVDVSWVYAQTDATLADLRKLEEEELILLGEKATWRDSLATRDFVPAVPPALTPEQSRVWERVRGAINRLVLAHQTSPTPDVPSPTPPQRAGEGQGEGIGYVHTDLKDSFWQKLKPIARELRENPTPAENLLWQNLRPQNMSGYKFRRQHPIDRFIVDFYCAEAHLVIEVDGETHQYTKEEDAIRQEFLESQGLKVIRFTNDDVLQTLDSVIERIRSNLTIRSQPISPLSVYGEGMGEGSKSWREEEQRNGAVFLLHGVTGSGKTEIYLRAIELTLAQGRSAIFCVPEIALTAQTVRRVAARFGSRVAVVHSGLSDGERFDTWRRARDGLIQVVVGARSALFTPLPDVGLIVLDEMHDDSYKQSPPILPPYYDSRRVAEAMMRRNNGVLILGSATPDLETMYRAHNGEIDLLELPNRIMGHRARIAEQAEREGVLPRYIPASAEDALTIDLPPVQVVDMRRELKAGNLSIFSRSLQTALATVLERRQQAILFLNRRGQSTYVFCRDCGYVAACPRCDMPLTYHRAGEMLRCHHCGYQQPEPQVCPQCASARIKYFGAGTQQVEQVVREMFPQARTLRWDADTADTHEAHDTLLARFVERKADVLVGTQMIAKGLDLPLVTLVGVVSADMGLALPDFRATERTFQILTQVAGRAGRGLLGGRVVLQTYQPDHYVVAAASKHDYAGFYARELAYRRELGYPPFRRIVRILFRYDSETKAQSEAERAASLLRHRLRVLGMTSTELIGPAPCFFTRINKAYRWHLLLRGPDPLPALHGVEIGKGWYVDVDPVDVL